MIRGLPYDAELEYLESTGTQWVDTGVVNAVDVEISCNFTCNASGNATRAIFGAYYPSLPKQRMASAFSSWNTAAAKMYVYLGASSLVDVANNDINNVTMTGSKCYFNGSEVYSSANFTGSELTLWLFAANNSVSNHYPFTGRIYSCKIWKNGVLVLDLIPVRVGSGASAVGYMYDRVSRRLFGNAGSGAFVLGPDKAVPILSLHRYAAPIVTEWVDGYRYLNTGALDNVAVCSALKNYVPITVGHTYTIYGGPGGFTNRYGLVYNSNMERIAGINQTKADATVEYTATGTAAYLRWTIYTQYKDNVYLYDQTDGKYLVKDGRVLVSDTPGRVALGKMGVGANLVFNEEDYIMTTQLTITENCTNMATATTHIQTLLNASGIDADAIGFIKLHSESPRNNALLAASFMMRTIPSGVQSRLRVRAGVIQLVNSDAGYDADVQVGDVYDVYVLKKTEGWEQ